MHNDCSYIEHLHLLFCAHLLNIFLFYIAVRHFISPKCLGVSGLCNLKLQQFSFLLIQTLHVMIVRTFTKMCMGDPGPEQSLVLLFSSSFWSDLIQYIVVCLIVIFGFLSYILKKLVHN